MGSKDITLPDGAIINLDSEQGKEIYRHSTAHILAQAVKRLFPEVRLAIGPPIENGFYYDFEKETPFSSQDLEIIESEMRRIIDDDLPIVREEVSKDEAVRRFCELGEKYKVELLNDLGDEEVTVYRQGEFEDLCRGPHLPSTGMVKAFKLLSVAGAYWRGDEKREMLQRIYGTAFPYEDDLAAYLHMMDEATKRDHRKLGKELDLYSVHDEAGAGLIFYHPKGTILRSVIEDFSRKEHIRRGYQPVMIPHIADARLWEISGHNDYYRENMYYMQIDERDYALKPMNCPGHILIYQTKARSYRELPMRFFELGTVYRYEKSGVLHGLMRVRGFTQDDAHIFCRPDQLTQELIGVIDFAFYMLRTFGFNEYEIYLATRPEKSVGEDETWERATQALIDALNEHELEYIMDPGGGAFYGPKIDVKLKDALGRAWQGPTIQLDFNLPERFDVTYVGSDGEKHRPAMVHRTVLGSMERFIGVLIENYGGAFPTWLAPVQVRVMSVGERHADYAKKVKKALLDSDVRAEADCRDEKIGYRIREAQLERIPYMIIVGDREVENQTVAVRARKNGDIGAMSLGEFTSMIAREIRERS